MTGEEFLLGAGWRRGESREILSGGDWHDPITGEHYWNIREPLRIQAAREVERLSFVLSHCTLTLHTTAPSDDPASPFRQKVTIDVDRVDVEPKP